MVFKGKLFFWIALHYKHTSNTLHRRQITDLSRFGGGVCHLLIVWHPPIPKVRNDESITYIIARSRGWRGTVKIWCLWGKKLDLLFTNKCNRRASNQWVLLSYGVFKPCLKVWCSFYPDRVKWKKTTETCLPILSMTNRCARCVRGNFYLFWVNPI